MSLDDNREISEFDAGVMRQSLGLAEHQELPEKLVAKYWELKRCFDRTGTIIRSNELAFLAFLHGHGKPTDKEKTPPTVVEMWRKKQIKPEAAVDVLHRNKWTPATLKLVNSNDEIIVQIVGDPDERKFTAKDVRPAEVAA